MMRWRAMLAALALAVAGAVAAAPSRGSGDAPAQASVEAISVGEDGVLWLRPNPDALRLLGVRRAGGRPAEGLWSLPLEARRSLRVELGDGAPTRFVAGEMGVPALRFVRADGTRSPSLRLVPEPAEPLGWRLVDAHGAHWLSITHAMRSPDLARDGIRLVTADLRVGPALAAWSGDAPVGTPLGNVTLHVPLPPQLASAAARARAKSCAMPNWPGTPGFVTDLALTDMIDVFNGPGVSVLRCRTGNTPGCDGPGNFDGEVVFVPSALLANHAGAEAADIPWYLKFSAPRPPYGNDQHPYLVWNMYRIDADGRLEQIGRSGLKHAFATANDNCHPDAQCPAYGNVLGRACEDIYNAGSNDIASALGPRNEVVPATGVWGRCGSVFDDTDGSAVDGLDGCDGVQDAPPDGDLYWQRLKVRESAIEPAGNPGARYFIDAWYVVRDDRNILNGMGFRELVPTWNGSSWTPGGLGAFRQGSVLDQWLETGPVPLATQRSLLESPEGQALVATRVLPLPNGRYRYDYAVANFELTRAQFHADSAEPNLRMLGNQGLSALELVLDEDVTAEQLEYRDGDATAANDWTAAPVAPGIRWSAPGGTTFDWGSQVFLRIVSDAPPGAGQMRLVMTGAGAPAHYSVDVLVPADERLFRSSFE